MESNFSSRKLISKFPKTSFWIHSNNMKRIYDAVEVTAPPAPQQYYTAHSTPSLPTATYSSPHCHSNPPRPLQWPHSAFYNWIFSLMWSRFNSGEPPHAADSAAMFKLQAASHTTALVNNTWLTHKTSISTGFIYLTPNMVAFLFNANSLLTNVIKQ